jgi:hypothetical protein
MTNQASPGFPLVRPHLSKEGVADGVTMFPSLKGIHEFRVTRAARDLGLRNLRPGRLGGQRGLQLRGSLGQLSGSTWFSSSLCNHVRCSGNEQGEKDSNESALKEFHNQFSSLIW